MNGPSLQSWLLDVPRSLPVCVRKRDGSIEPFDAEKIGKSFQRVGLESGEYGGSEQNRAKLRAVWDAAPLGHERTSIGSDDLAELLLQKLAVGHDLRIVTTQELQDVFDEVLAERGFLGSLRLAIAWRENKNVNRDRSAAMVDAISTIEEYVGKTDWRVQANANQGFSLGGMILSVAGKVTANYWLGQVYPPLIGQAHREGDLHIHDLDMLSGYCAGWSLRMLLAEGFNGVANKVESRPPRRLRTALGQMVNFLGTLQNEWAGAQAFSSFDTYLAPYLRREELSYAEVRQCMEEFVFNLNVPSRWGTQTPFTNLTFDWTCPADLREVHPVVGEETMPFVYGDLQLEMNMLNQAFLEVMMAGDARERVFTFPIPTYNITDDFPWGDKNADRLFEMTAKYGLPYFQNFLSSDLQPHMVRSMCCRLQLDLRELMKRGNGLFGSAEQTGSLGVVTINFARLGYLYRGAEKALWHALDLLLEMARDSLEIKRKVIDERMAAGLFPYTRRYLGTLRNHFSTIGVNGLNECIRNFTGDHENITTPWGKEFAIRLLDHMRLRMVGFQEETGHLYNLEASPAEGATYRFARTDRQRFPGILQAGTSDAPYYTNSSQLPVGFTNDPFVALMNQEDLQRKYTGGTVFHLYMPERISSAAACRELVRRTLTRFRIPYLTVTPTFSICPVHGYLAGEHPFCPLCDEACLAEKKKAAA